jgi:hypothetical protein
MKVTHRSYVPDGPGEIKLIPEEGGCSGALQTRCACVFLVFSTAWGPLDIAGHSMS